MVMDLLNGAMAYTPREGSGLFAKCASR